MLTCLNIYDGNIDFSMTCFHPIRATRFYDPESGKYVISFDDRKLGVGDTLLLPCGQCLGCRLDHAKMWSIRCMHEAQMHEKNCFITLTYDDAHLPDGGSLKPKDLQDFWKRLRFRFPNSKIRYYACGEYGDKLSRPHYHAIVFGFDFPDKKAFFRSRRGDIVYRSKILEELWDKGISSIGSVTPESCGYVARYVVKKFKGKGADDFYHGLVPEFVVMSRRPGIAREWFEKFKSDVFPGDFVVDKKGHKVKTPRYYEKLLSQLYPDMALEIDAKRAEQLYERLLKDPDLNVEFDGNFVELNKRRKVSNFIVDKRVKKLVRSMLDV